MSVALPAEIACHRIRVTPIPSSTHGAGYACSGSGSQCLNPECHVALPAELACAAADPDTLIPGDDIECDNCGDLTREWDWTPAYDRFCVECLGVECDASADRGCWQYHNGRGA